MSGEIVYWTWIDDHSITQLFVADSLTLRRAAWATMAVLFVALAGLRKEENNMVPLARCKRTVINFHIVRVAYKLRIK